MWLESNQIWSIWAALLIFCLFLFCLFPFLTFPLKIISLFEDLSDERPEKQGSAIRGRLIIFSAGLMHIEISGGGVSRKVFIVFSDFNSRLC